VAPRGFEPPAPWHQKARFLMQHKAKHRRSYGTGSLFTVARADGTAVYYGKWRDQNDQQVKRRIGPVRTPHKPDGLTKSDAEARLRELIAAADAAAPVEHARTLDAAAEAWIARLQTAGAKPSTVRAYRAALDKWFLPILGGRSLDRITESDVEHAIARMRKAGRSDKSIRNYAGVLRALFNFAAAVGGGRPATPSRTSNCRGLRRTPRSGI
jgi:Phage integrase, N-terminal SAM-like domain